jgi:hypothetical protein
MPNCTGCKLSAKFTKDPTYQGMIPILDPCEFAPQPGTNPDGSCTGTPCVQATPCAPIGGVQMTSCYTNHMTIRFWNAIDGQWDTATLEAGFSWVILVYGVTVQCDSKFLVGELCEQDDAATPLGKIELVCSKCEQT